MNLTAKIMYFTPSVNHSIIGGGHSPSEATQTVRFSCRYFLFPFDHVVLDGSTSVDELILFLSRSHHCNNKFCELLKMNFDGKLIW